MYEELFSRFTEEFKSSIEDPDIHLSYTDRQRIKGGQYAEVAEEKLPTTASIVILRVEYAISKFQNYGPSFRA